MNVEHFRNLLLEERGRIVEAIENLHDENAVPMAAEVPESGIADTGTVTLDRELDFSLEENAVRVLHEIDAALGRIDDGTYGTCTRCGTTISEERLEAMPYATLCIDCKRREERS